MKSKFRFRKLGIMLAAVVAATSLAGFTGSFAAAKTDVMVSAAASLKGPLGEIEKTYEKSHKNVDLIVNYGASGALQTQIENGAKVNLFISAATKQMDALSKKKMIDEKSRVNLLGNKLVLITQLNNAKVKGFGSLTTDAVKTVALGETKSVPAGTYAAETFKSLGILEAVSKKAVYGKDVKTVLTWVETGNADAGMVYYSDVTGNTKVKVVAVASDKSHSKIIYPAALIKGASSAKAKEAKAFLDYLKGKQAKIVFLKYRFDFLIK
jgi:molybdate transport system substrate-binding protein